MPPITLPHSARVIQSANVLWQRTRFAGIPASPPAEPDAPEEPESPIKPVTPDNPDLPPEHKPPEIDDPSPDGVPVPVREPPVMPTPIAAWVC